VNVNVDPARRHHQAINIDDCLTGLRLQLSDGGDPAVVQPDVGPAIEAKRRIDDVSATEKGCASHDIPPARAEKNRLAALCGPGDGVAAESCLLVCATKSLV
jgi:hypothetical protein